MRRLGAANCRGRVCATRPRDHAIDETYIQVLWSTLERLVACFPELSNDERYSLSSYVQVNQKFPFGHIVPSDTTIRTQEYMVENGWFPEDPEL